MTKQILQKLKQHDQQFAEIRADIGTLNGDVKALKADVVELKTDVKVLKTDVKVLKTDVAFLKEDAHKKGILYEEHSSKLDKILEVVTNNLINSVGREEYDRKYSRHENRISALEHVVRKNV